MAVKTREEILSTIKTRLGDNADDESLAFLEDITDTLNDFESRANGDGDWKVKYEENDKAWREKYKARFFSTAPEEKDAHKDEEKDEETNTPTTFEELFTQEG